MKSCVIRNIPNSKPKHEIANQLRMKGLHTRKRGRGARQKPLSYWIGCDGWKYRSGGEYQDLPIEKAARFSMYFDDSKGIDYPRLYFDYVGVRDGKMVVRAHHA